jgi:DNA primase
VSDKEQIVVSILKNILHTPKQEYSGIVQYEFNCPSAYCRKDKDKFNLSYNSKDFIFKCWKCKYKGYVHKIVDDYGSKDDIDKLSLLLPKINQTKSENYTKKELAGDNITCDLPEGFRSLTKKHDSKYYKLALQYLINRGINEDIIKKYNIGYTESGPRKYRIIIPSYNINGEVNYYEARAYMSFVKPSYLKPKEPHKTDIIFNAKNINFDLPVYLVEGVFDMFPLYNAIPLLGKDISELLLSKLLKHKTKVILCLDEDAVKDSIAIYNMLESYGIDVYFVEVKDDIAKTFEIGGKQAVIDAIKNYRKLDFEYIFSLSLKDKKSNAEKISESELIKDWEKIQSDFNYNQLHE